MSSKLCLSSAIPICEWTPEYPTWSPWTSKAKLCHRKVSTFASRWERDWNKATFTLFKTQSLWNTDVAKLRRQYFGRLTEAGLNRVSSTVRSSTGLSEIQTMKANKHALYWHWPERSCFLNWCNFPRTLSKTVTNVVCPPYDNLLIPTVFYRVSNTAIPVRQPRIIT
jgi:hypothetical protein